MAPQVLARLLARALLLGDCLYGCGAFAVLAAAACQRVGGHCFLRARAGANPGVVKQLKDESRLVLVPVFRKRLRIRRPTGCGCARSARGSAARGPDPDVALWTNLVDPRSGPALESAQLYAQRSEHELHFREVKRRLRKNAVLQTDTVETGAQEIAAIVLASAMLAAERVTTAGDDLPALRTSLPKLLLVVQAMWFTLAFGEGVLTERQTQTVLKRGYAHPRQC